MNIHVSQNSLHSCRDIWVNLANNQRYADLVEKEDIKTFLIRYDNEGLPFLTSCLPLLGKALDVYFSTGEFTCPSNFSSDEHGLPIFLGKAIRLALDQVSRAVDCVRQLSYVFYKLEVDYDQKTVEESLEKFKRIDQDIPLTDLTSPEVEALVSDARLLILRILCNTNPLDIKPRHGTGATACRTANKDKFYKLRYYAKLDEVFPYSDYFFFNYNHLLDDYDYLQEAIESVPKARLCLVPKDSRGPRLISCEPAELMFIQQGLMRSLYRTIENHHLTRGYVNFISQGTNQLLAKLSSLTGEYATIDLSDASDRVSLNLVERLFPDNWMNCFKACRSDSTILPDGSEVIFNKFAPMGSACCFPVEALVFWAIASASIRKFSGKKSPGVYVYGDDIIVEACVAEAVMKGLESVGLLVNRSKSFVRGLFRESCGGEYHNGYDVTPVRVRSFPHASSNSLPTDTDLCNLFIAKFGYDSCIDLLNVIERSYQTPFPRSQLQLPCCILADSRASNDTFYRRRYNFHLQRYEYRIRSVYTRAYAYRDPDWAELFRKELTRPNVGERDPDIYGRFDREVERSLDPGFYTESHSVQLKWQWTWLG